MALSACENRGAHYIGYKPGTGGSSGVAYLKKALEFTFSRNCWMYVQKSASADIEAAVHALGPGSLTEAGLTRHIRPLFSRVLRHSSGRIYLANHSLGRPLDRTADDVAAGIGYWYTHLDKAWDPWLAAIQTFREQVARLLQAPRADCVVPRANAGQALRTVLNCYDKKLRVVTTGGVQFY